MDDLGGLVFSIAVPTVAIGSSVYEFLKCRRIYKRSSPSSAQDNISQAHKGAFSIIMGAVGVAGYALAKELYRPSYQGDTDRQRDDR